MIIPAIKTEGVFTFSTPFDGDDINNKYYTVVSVRMLREMFKNEEDPLNTVYLPRGMTEDEFNADLDADVPLIGLSSSGSGLLYVPANRITGMPKLSGVKYHKKMININLGLVPETIALDGVLNNVKDVVMDGLGIIPTTKISSHSSTFLKTEEEHEQYLDFLANHPRVKVFKSWKEKYLELTEEFNALKNNYDQLTKFMCKTWDNNVTFLTDIPSTVKQVMTKKIVINCVGNELAKSFSLNDLLFSVCSPVGTTVKPIYAKGFTVRDVSGRTSYYGVLGNVPMTIVVTEGNLGNSHLPYVFSDMSYTEFSPFIKTLDTGGSKQVSRATIEILLDEPIYITAFKMRVYHSTDMHMGTCRLIMYNTDDNIIYNTTFEKNRDFTSATQTIEKNIKDALQIRGDLPQPLPDATS